MTNPLPSFSAFGDVRRRRHLLSLANEDPASAIGLANAFTVVQKDILRIPYGDFPNGKVVQRFDQDSARKIAADFDGAAPVYVGHPDHPAFANIHTDQSAYGWIVAVEAGPDAMLLRTKWSPEGETLIANARYKWFSPHWDCRKLKSPTSVQLVQPVHLNSIGLTNRPNIKAIGALANQDNKEGETQMKEKLLKLLGLANDTTDDQVVAGVTTLADERKSAQDKVKDCETALANEKTARAADKTAADTALANEKTARAADKTASDAALAQANTALAAEKKAKIEVALANAIGAGKITVAQKPQWTADLEKDFDGALAKLANAKALPTGSVTQGLGARKTEVMTRQERVLALVNEHMTKTGEKDYIKAFANVRAANETLFKEMHQPEVKK